MLGHPLVRPSCSALVPRHAADAAFVHTMKRKAPGGAELGDRKGKQRVQESTSGSQASQVQHLQTVTQHQRALHVASNALLHWSRKSIPARRAGRQCRISGASRVLPGTLQRFCQAVRAAAPVLRRDAPCQRGGGARPLMDPTCRLLTVTTSYRTVAGLTVIQTLFVWLWPWKARRSVQCVYCGAHSAVQACPRRMRTACRCRAIESCCRPGRACFALCWSAGSGTAASTPPSWCGAAHNADTDVMPWDKSVRAARAHMHKFARRAGGASG